MGLAKALVRPVYRKFFEKPLWWFLAILKKFFLDDISARIAAIETKVDRMEATTAAEWEALEQLLLAVLRQRETRVTDWQSEIHYDPISAPDQANGVNEPHVVR